MQTLFLLSIGGLAVFWDLWKGKIPNLLIVSGICCGWCYQIADRGIPGICTSLGGMLLPLAVLAPLFYFRMMGAGDIKLFAVIGSFIGVKLILLCIVFSFLAGAVISIFVIARRRILMARLHYFFAYFSNFFQTKRWRSYRKQQDLSGQIHFSVPIFISVIMYIGGMY